MAETMPVDGLQAVEKGSDPLAPREPEHQQLAEKTDKTTDPEPENHPLAPGEDNKQQKDESVSDIDSSEKADYEEAIVASQIARTSLNPEAEAVPAEEWLGDVPTTMTATVELLESNSSTIKQTEAALQLLLKREQFLKAHQLSLEQEQLIAALSTPLGFHKGRPILALLVHRCCLRWGLYQADKSGVLNRILEEITAQIEEEDSTPRADERAQQLAHFTAWLASTCVLLYLVHKQTAPKAGQESAAVRSRMTAIKKTVASRMEMFGMRVASLMSTGGRPVHQQHPALVPRQEPAAAEVDDDKSGANQEQSAPSLFRNGLDAVVQRQYTVLREVCKRALAALVSECVQAPPEASTSPLGSPRPAFTIEDDTEEHDGNNGPAAEKLAALRSWCELVSTLNEVLEVAKAQMLPRTLTRCLFWQLLSFIDAQLFNQLLLRPECCSSSNAKYVMEGLNRLDSWLLEVGQEYIGDAYHTLQHIRQAISFLVVENKERLSIDDIANGLCPALNIQQIYRLSTTFWDNAAAETVSGEVLEEMKGRNVTSNGGLIVTFLLEEDNSLPFTSGGSTVPSLMQLEDQELNKGCPVPEILKGEPAVAEVFRFLEVDLPSAS